MSLNLEEIVLRVAAILHRPVDDGYISVAVDAAIGYVSIQTGYAEAGLELPDDALTANGIVGLATRMFIDPAAPVGTIGAIGDPSFEPMFTPEDLYRHWHHYFDHLTISWGVA